MIQRSKNYPFVQTNKQRGVQEGEQITPNNAKHAAQGKWKLKFWGTKSAEKILFQLSAFVAVQVHESRRIEIWLLVTMN